MFNIPISQLLTASLFVAVAGISSLIIAPNIMKGPADMFITPTGGTVLVGETFEIQINVRSKTPVNVFQGQLEFNSEVLSIKTIDYNTSIADLWAEEPWFSNGDGALAFIGGTTRPGGFTGEGELISIIFTAEKIGEGSISMSEARILQHNGLGTEVELNEPIDALFAVTKETITKQSVIEKSVDGPKVQIVEKFPSTDLNNDGKQTIVDISIFMADLATQNLKSDFNKDGSVNLIDLSIIINQ